jgi:putative transcriptional regulator
MRNDVQRLRELEGISREQLGERLRHPVRRQTIYSLEIGRYEPYLRLALDIAHYFGKPVEEIFHDTP